ncbi:hypothetical protein HPB52_002734 [Rhipicephalus sanguineus]|uniref:Uncharacterized protein n=1 Tax=Rhipicephalus sanguineus TaxID=34632 RepID=A0A9D4PHN6_RHISA|nr:hypothetical protein HPB52_002734 [Rhipicephalus sanguineus]
MACSPEESAYIHVRPEYSRAYPELQLILAGKTITRVAHLRILGLPVRENYALPCQATRRKDIEQADRLLRSTFKAALVQPQNASTAALPQRGMLNTHATATLLAQRE